MPNWCNNNIEIRGPRAKIEALWKAATAEEGGLLKAMVPMPEILRDTTSPTPDNIDSVQLEVMIAQTGHTNWYDWAVSKWGTKWDVDTEGLEYSEEGEDMAVITGYFDSAWSPPTGAYEKFCEANPDCTLEASYFEMGCDFGGFWSVDNGNEYLEDLQEEYKLPEEQQSDLFKRLDDEYALSEQFAEWNELEEDDD